MSERSPRTSERPPRNLGLDLVRSTEAAALAAGRWMGLYEPEQADLAAGRAMRSVLDGVEMEGRVVFGAEGRRGPQAIFQSGQRIGTGDDPQVDVVVDPIDGRDLLARGYPGAIAVAAVSPRGTMWAPLPAVYMEKIVVGPKVAPFLVPECLDAPAAWTLALVARAKGKHVDDLTAFVLDRPRHADLVVEMRNAGTHVVLRSDGDIAGALLACSPGSEVDILWVIGGIPEGLIAACAVKAAGGAMLGRLAPQSEAEWAAVREAGLDARQILTGRDLVASDAVFFAATGITDGPLLSGVRYAGDRATSNSIIMRGETRTRRSIQAEHLLEDPG
jgi:fructose-1,6-bisphosphatase II